MALDPTRYRGVPGVYILHFERPIADYATDRGMLAGLPGAYGDEQHYVGEASNVRKRVHSHIQGWARPDTQRGAAFTRRAGRQGIPFHLAFVQEEPDPDRRLAIEQEVQLDPRRWCLTCTAPADDAPGEGLW